MKIFKTLAPCEGKILTIDTIEHDGGLWLVPVWQDNHAEQWTRPAHMIRLDAIPHAKLGPGVQADFLVHGPIPKRVHDGVATPEEAVPYILVVRPDLKFPIEPTVH